jgi:hypothetical protein
LGREEQAVICQRRAALLHLAHLFLQRVAPHLLAQLLRQVVSARAVIFKQEAEHLGRLHYLAVVALDRNLVMVDRHLMHYLEVAA